MRLIRTNMTLEGPCIIFAIYIQSNEIHNVVALIKFLLVLRCQLYMFRTVTVHPQELLCRYCMCRLWYVVRDALCIAKMMHGPSNVKLTSFTLITITRWPKDCVPTAQLIGRQSELRMSVIRLDRRKTLRQDVRQPSKLFKLDTPHHKYTALPYTKLPAR